MKTQNRHKFAATSTKKSTSNFFKQQMSNFNDVWMFFSSHCYFVDDESGEKSVSVLLNGEESELTFIDLSTAEMSVSIIISFYNKRTYIPCVAIGY